MANTAPLDTLGPPPPPLKPPPLSSPNTHKLPTFNLKLRLQDLKLRIHENLRQLFVTAASEGKSEGEKLG